MIERCEYRMEKRTLRGLRNKVRMMGIPIDELTHVMVDNMSVVCNTTRIESILKKKSNRITYHFVRESAVAKEIKIQHVGIKGEYE